MSVLASPVSYVNSVSHAPHLSRPELRIVRPHDWALERSRRGADDASVSRTKGELVESAARQINALLQRADAAGIERLRGAVRRLWEALGELLFDDAPTPQVSLDADDDLQVEWLVNGTSLTLVMDQDGGSLWAVDEHDEELFADEWAASDWPYSAYGRAGELLRAMARGVAVRAPR